MNRRLNAVVLVTGLLTVPSLRAYAQTAPTEDARALFERGQTAYSQGGYEESVQLWQRAYSLDPRPALQFNLSQALERLGRLEEAATALETYISSTTADDPRLADARARLAAIRERLARTGVQITSNVEGARVTVDGVDQGLLPRPDALRLAPGSHEIRVAAPGYREHTASVTVVGGQVAQVNATLVPEPSTSPAEGPAGGSQGLNLGPILTVAGGAALVVGGVVVGVLALDQAGSAPSRMGAEADSARSMALVSDVLWIGGAVVAAAGIVWWIVDASSGPSESVAWVPVLGPELTGVVALGTF